jgi:DNA invertase Pin-like site-specific DNA recombinase
MSADTGVTSSVGAGLPRRSLREARYMMLGGTLLAVLAMVCRCLMGIGHNRDDLCLPVEVSVPVAPGRRKTCPAKEPKTVASVICASYSRFSSDGQREVSIRQQQRKCCERATRNEQRISRELEFYDEAVSGTRRHRKGLDAMLAAAEEGRFQVLYFYNLSRLARESVITMPLLKKLVYTYKVRVISVTEGIDSDLDSWEVIATVLSLVHERYIKDLANAVLRGQEDAVLAGFCVGDYCFGYKSEVVPGTEKGRRGRNAKPRTTYVIDDETAAWVIRIFNWFVHEGQSLSWIARELNRLGAPKDHRATTKLWHHQYLPRLLRRKKYVGWWPWGEKKNVRDPSTGQITQEDRPKEECEKWLRHFPHLQLIDDDTFEQAERLLQENEEKCEASRKQNGQLHGSKPGADRQHPRHLLSVLIRCGECGRTFYVGGANGKYLFCPGYRLGVCGCKTTLRRDRAERMILDEIGRRILANPTWRDVVIEEMRRAWKVQESQLPSELAAAEKALADVDRRIKRLLDKIEDGFDDPELGTRLAERRAEKRKRTQELERIKRKDENRLPAPTEAWVDEQLRNLGDRLSGATPAAAHALRELVGGEIVVTEVRLPGRERHYLQGRFAIRTAALVNSLDTSHRVAESDIHAEEDRQGEEIVIDFREPSPSEEKSERAFELDQKGWLRAEIAREVACSKSRLTKLLGDAYARRGLEMPDGRTRRSTLDKKHQSQPLYQVISDEVFTLLEAVSAYTLNLAERPEGKQLHCALRRGDHVIFARLERAFRNLRDMQIQMSQWRDRGINIHFATENVDATTAMGQLQLNLMGAMAQWYSEYISERTKEGFEFFKDKPGFHANGRAWMGFRRVTHNGKVTGVVPIPEVRRVMKKIVQLHDKLGLGFREIPDVIGPQLAREGHRNGSWGKHRCWKAYKVEKELVRPAVKAGRFPEC